MQNLWKTLNQYFCQNEVIEMKIIGVAACTAGIAHTYIAKEKLINAAQKAGHEIHIETQGVIGIEDELTPVQIAEADVVVFAIDIAICGKDRFKGKRSLKYQLR